MDGTWNDPHDDTNVNQLCGRVKETERAPGGGGHRKCYIKGVGNGRLDRWRGGAFGYGVDENIREGYEFIAENHQPGDEIFIVGYSRGAFTARSLAGMIVKCGIVPPSVLSAKQLFRRYRDLDRPGLREMTENEDDPGKRTDEDRQVLAESRIERIRFIGVFDTVGSLGIPGDLGKVFVRKYQFHDTRLSGYVDVARHAVAIDEDRPEFEPTLWTAVPIRIPGHDTSIEQRWFVGAHSDVGGGGKLSREPAPLSALAREWIATEAHNTGLDIEDAKVPLTGDQWASPYSRSFATWLGPLARLVPGRKPYLRPVNTAEGETLAPSVLQRWRDGNPEYRPRNPHLAPWVKQHLV